MDVFSDADSWKPLLPLAKRLHNVSSLDGLPLATHERTTVISVICFM